MNLIKKNWIKFLFFLSTILIPTISFADQINSTPCDPGKICNPIRANSITGFVDIFLTGVLKVGIPIVALAVIYCGFLFVAARGNSEKLSKAKSALLYTLIGAAILLGSWSIAILVSETVNSL
jgi:hypothetical protein